jgi:hypothetical protein
VERLDQNIVLAQLDDLCMVHVGRQPVDAGKTRVVGERLKDYLENRHCRKLVISFEGVENIYGFVLNESGEPGVVSDSQIRRGDPLPAASEMWLG